jgi:hypothetical protein
LLLPAKGQAVIAFVSGLRGRRRAIAEVSLKPETVVKKDQLLSFSETINLWPISDVR